MKLLVLVSRFPHPLDKGDKLRAFHQIAELAARHEITLCALSHAPVGRESRAVLDRLCARVEVIQFSALETAAGLVRAALTGLPLQVGYFLSARAQRRIDALIQEVRPDRVFCQLVRTAEYAKRMRVPVAFDYMDAFSWGFEQRAALLPGMLGGLLRLEAARLARYEAGLLEHFPKSAIISEQDRDHIGHPGRDAIRVVGNGVDLETFRPRPAAKEHDLLFVGNMAYPPNVLAAEKLVREILPRVRQDRSCRVLIAGASPTRRVRRLAGDGVTVTGWVDDISACYAGARVFVAPMAMGTGLQNKLLQALAMAVPCVTTPSARRALGASDEEVWIGRDASEIADRTLTLLKDPERAAALGARGRAFAVARFRWSDAGAALEALWA